MRHSRLTPALLVVALLSATPALPQGGRGAAPPRTASFGEVLRGFLPDFLTRLWGLAEAGCQIDPYGGCRPSAALPTTSVRAELGCQVDPYGGCASQAATPTPAGLTSVQANAGCQLDPYGGCANQTTVQPAYPHH
jgi:hypothetical protein